MQSECIDLTSPFQFSLSLFFLNSVSIYKHLSSIFFLPIYFQFTPICLMPSFQAIKTILFKGQILVARNNDTFIAVIFPEVFNNIIQSPFRAIFPLLPRQSSVSLPLPLVALFCLILWPLILCLHFQSSCSFDPHIFHSVDLPGRSQSILQLNPLFKY